MKRHECHDILMLGKSPIKWRQHPDMTIAVDWDVKHQFKQTNLMILFPSSSKLLTSQEMQKSFFDHSTTLKAD